MKKHFEGLSAEVLTRRAVENEQAALVASTEADALSHRKLAELLHRIARAMPSNHTSEIA